MTIIRFEFTAKLEKVISFQAADGFETEGQFLFLKLICEGCGETSERRNDICISPSRKFQVYYKNNYMQVHAFTKCNDCGALGIIQMRPDLGPNNLPLTADLSRAGKYAPLMHFNIEGLEVNQLSLIANFVATTDDNRRITIPFIPDQDYEERGGTGVAVRNPKLAYTVIDIDD